MYAHDVVVNYNFVTTHEQIQKLLREIHVYQFFRYLGTCLQSMKDDLRCIEIMYAIHLATDGATAVNLFQAIEDIERNTCIKFKNINELSSQASHLVVFTSVSTG